jgi:hypothetical protein
MQQLAVPLWIAQEKKQQSADPDNEENGDNTFDEIEGEKGLGALEEVRRNDHDEQKPQPGIEASARDQDEEDEEQQGDQQDIRDLGIADAGERQRGVHADVFAAAKQVAVVACKDERCDSEALAELFEHESNSQIQREIGNGCRWSRPGGKPLGDCGCAALYSRTASLIFSKRKRTRPLSRVMLERVRKRPAQAASRSASVSEP